MSNYLLSKFEGKQTLALTCSFQKGAKGDSDATFREGEKVFNLLYFKYLV